MHVVKESLNLSYAIMTNMMRSVFTSCSLLICHCLDAIRIVLRSVYRRSRWYGIISLMLRSHLAFATLYQPIYSLGNRFKNVTYSDYVDALFGDGVQLA
jgi:hypothetical protein